MPATVPVVRAIDVGYGNTKYTTGGERHAVRCAHFPSQAFPSLLDQSRDALGGARKTVAIPLNGLFYEVGPEIALAGNPFRGSHGHDRYSETPEYLALMRGALRYMKVEQIDLLVVGLPVALFAPKRALLEKLAAGRHEVAPGRFVTVRKALVVAQPHGALVQFASQTERLAQVSQQLNLVIDAGYRTFDWLVAVGMRLVPAKSHSINRGMLDMVKAMCRRVSADLGVDYRDIDALDAALRSGKSPLVGHEPYDLERLKPITAATARQAVSTMIEWLGDTREFDNIVLVGGAAGWFRSALKDAFPKHKVHEVCDPLYANVKGFHIAGVDWIDTHTRREAEASADAALESTVRHAQAPSLTLPPPSQPVSPAAQISLSQQRSEDGASPTQAATEERP